MIAPQALRTFGCPFRCALSSPMTKGANGTEYNIAWWVASGFETSSMKPSGFL
jgi:hypothetical protein